MTTDRRLEQLVADALRGAAPAAPPDDLVRDVVFRAGRTRRRPRWLALLTEGPMVRPPVVLVGSPKWRAASIALAVVLVAIAGTLALVGGGWLQRRDATVVLPKATLGATPEVTRGPVPTATEAEVPGALMVYTVARRLQPGEGRCTETAPREACTALERWISKTDGTRAHRFVVDDPALWFPLSWSRDGGEILAQDLDTGRLGRIDPSGHLQRRYDLGPCPLEGFCWPEPGSSSWSPDATRLVFDWEVQDFAKARATSGLSMLDLETGKVTEVAGTRSVNRGGRCWTSTKCEGLAQTPRWSPDGARLVFSRRSMSSEPGSRWTSAAIFTVGVDGTDLRRVTPEGMYATDASWSPDGSTIVFTDVQMVYDKENDDVTSAGQDIYTIRADGTDLRRLTDDGASFAPRWTADGRLTFFRGDANWTMAADGGAETELGFDLPTLTAGGCVSCLYPGPDVSSFTQEALWQPVPGR